jgi:hypothetical protein
MNNNYLKIDLELFSMDLYFSHKKESFSENLGSGNNEGAEFITVHADRDIYILVSNEFDSAKDPRFLQCLTHECNHAALCVMLYSGILLSYENQEILCYLQDFIFRKCYEFSLETIKPKRKKRNAK